MPRSRAAMDQELDMNGFPNQFCELALYWWTVKDLKRVEKELGDFVNPYPFYLRLRFDI
jgi:hypothetical protein